MEVECGHLWCLYVSFLSTLIMFNSLFVMIHLLHHIGLPALANHTLTDATSHSHPVRVLYSPERLASIAQEAAKKSGSAFSLNDRIGLVHDAMALAKSGHLKVSAALEMVNILRGEEECAYFRLFTSFLSRVLIVLRMVGCNDVDSFGMGQYLGECFEGGGYVVGGPDGCGSIECVQEGMSSRQTPALLTLSQDLVFMVLWLLGI